MTSLVTHEIGLVAFLLVILGISLSNLRAIPRLDRREQPSGALSSERLPLVSILVPARNEEENIEPCVRSLLAQDYPDFELIVLDDSDPDSPRVLERLQALGPVRVIRGRPLPLGWTGKNWACHQLSRQARGEVLLFADADTRHAPTMLRRAVETLQDDHLDLLSILPRQRLNTWAERLVLPMLPWSLHTFFPFALAKRTGWRFLAAAVGQVMLFRRGTYEVIGGHGLVRSQVVEDRALVRAIAERGLRWALVDGTSHVGVRMYTRPREVLDGLSKNLFGVFGYNLPVFAFVWSWLLWVAWEPPLILILYAAGVSWIPRAALAPAAAATGLALAVWWISNARFGLPKRQTFLHPITLALVYLIAARSVAWRYLRLGSWKGRPLTLPTTTITEPRSAATHRGDRDRTA
jgi:chlorobactene glucosyltransferase